MRDGKQTLSDRHPPPGPGPREFQAKAPGARGPRGRPCATPTPIIEVKPRRVGGATYQVPVEIRGDRRLSLGVRWLVQAARKRSGKSMSEKLAAEFVDAANGLGAGGEAARGHPQDGRAPTRPSAISSGSPDQKELEQRARAVPLARTRNIGIIAHIDAGKTDRHRADPLLHEEDLQDR
jgi:hypothetical protein